MPLEHPLEVGHDRDAALLLDDHGCLLAEARPPAAEVELTVPDTPTPEEARAAAGLLGRDGRKLTAGSALLGPDGEVLAAARAIWIAVARTAGGSG